MFAVTFGSRDDISSLIVWPPDEAEDVATEFPDKPVVNYSDGTQERVSPDDTNDILLSIPGSRCYYELSAPDAAYLANEEASLREIVGSAIPVTEALPTSTTTTVVSGPKARLVVSGTTCAYLKLLVTTGTMDPWPPRGCVPLPWTGYMSGLDANNSSPYSVLLEVAPGQDSQDEFSCEIEVPGHEPVTQQAPEPGAPVQCMYPAGAPLVIGRNAIGGVALGEPTTDAFDALSLQLGQPTTTSAYLCGAGQFPVEVAQWGALSAVFSTGSGPAFTSKFLEFMYNYGGWRASITPGPNGPPPPPIGEIITPVVDTAGGVTIGDTLADLLSHDPGARVMPGGPYPYAVDADEAGFFIAQSGPPPTTSAGQFHAPQVARSDRISEISEANWGNC